MEDSLDILKKVGALKIHKDTHISRDYVDSIIEGSFDGLTFVQLNGFISILEREYDVDLSELKREGKAYFKEEVQEPSKASKVFVTSTKEKNNTQMYIVAGAILFIAVLYYSFGYESAETQAEQEPTPALVQDREKPALIVLSEATSMKKMIEEKAATEEIVTEEVATKDVALEETVVEEAVLEVVVPEVLVAKEVVLAAVKTLKILPVNRIWAGYINIKTNKKRQKIFKKEFSIDVEKDWLLLFGSGTVYLEVNGEKKKFSSSKKMRFKYSDGKFKKITLKEFKRLNKGREW